MFILELVTIYMNEIYTLKGKGADHWLKPVFSAEANLTSHSMYITVTEDSNSGYQYFKTLMPQTFSLEGRDNIEQELGKYIALSRSSSNGSKMFNPTCISYTEFSSNIPASQLFFIRIYAVSE